MKPNRISLLILSGLFLATGSTGCFGENEYADRMNELANRARSSSSDGSAALSKLIDFSRSNDYWSRYYALVYLGQVATGGRIEARNRAIPVVVGALDDKDHAIQRAAVSSIRDVGAEAVDRAILQLVRFVDGGEERDVSWYAAEALGKSRDERYREQVIYTLVSALDKSPPQLPPSAPQLRYAALSSLIELGRLNPQLILPELKKRASVKDAVFAEKIAEAIAVLEK
jgi:HEAT repeat protein